MPHNPDRLKFFDANKITSPTPPISPRLILTGPNPEFINQKKTLGSEYNIADLEIIRDLGQGNAGVVTELLHIPSKIVLVRKIYDLSFRPATRIQIIRELQQFHEFSSQYLLGFYGVFGVDSSIHLLLEHMDMGSIDNILYNHAGRFPEPSIKHIFRSALNGLLYLRIKHSMHHKNLKPSNILVNSAGEVRISDIAISDTLNEMVSSAHLGIKCYTDPVRLTGDLLNPHSDVWSLGLIIVEIALGTYPYPLNDGFDQCFNPDYQANQKAHLKAFENGESLPREFHLLINFTLKALPSIWNKNAEETITIFDLLSLLVDGPVPHLPKVCFEKDLIRLINECLKKDPAERTTIFRLDREPFLDSHDSSEKAAKFVKYLKLLVARTKQ